MLRLPMRVDTDFLIIGTGVAGLTLALELSKHGTVTCVTKRTRQDSATNYAQGGIAAVLDPDDSFAAHVADTLTTGGGISHPEVVEMVIADGPARIKELMAIGAEFSRQRDSDGQQLEDLDLTREGGHSARRGIHAGDITGREVQRALVKRAAPRAKPGWFHWWASVRPGSHWRTPARLQFQHRPERWPARA